MFEPLISICIPAYKKPLFVVRCLESIIKQNYKHVEVIISDDSPDVNIKIAIEPYNKILNITYFHNQPALTSPKNWNAALDKATGDLVMLMHQDDWFYAEDALDIYVNTFKLYPKIDFVFCQNTAIDESGKKIILQARPKLLKYLSQKPNHLLLAQVIGPPSNTMLRSQVNVRYDEQFVWLVDVDYYVRLLKKGHRYKYIEQHLVSIGLHDDQMTVFCRINEKIILKENILFAGKLEEKAFNDIVIYDYYWRLLRNFKVRDKNDIIAAGIHPYKISKSILHMLNLQQKVPLSVLKIGPISKTMMAFSYLTSGKFR